MIHPNWPQRINLGQNQGRKLLSTISHGKWSLTTTDNRYNHKRILPYRPVAIEFRNSLAFDQHLVQTAVIRKVRSSPLQQLR